MKNYEICFKSGKSLFLSSEFDLCQLFANCVVRASDFMMILSGDEKGTLAGIVTVFDVSYIAVKQ